MSIVRCECGQACRFPDEAKKFRCPKCRRVNRVPEEEDEPPRRWVPSPWGELIITASILLPLLVAGLAVVLLNVQKQPTRQPPVADRNPEVVKAQEVKQEIKQPARRIYDEEVLEKVFRQYLREAKDAFMHKHPDVALEKAETALLIHPESPEAIMWRGSAKVVLGAERIPMNYDVIEAGLADMREAAKSGGEFRELYENALRSYQKKRAENAKR